MNIETISQELGLVTNQIKSINKTDKLLCLVHKSWLKALTNNELITNQIYTGISNWNNDDIKSESWCKVYIKVFCKQPKQVIPLPRCNVIHTNNSEAPLSYCQLLHYVSQSNHKNLWKAAHKKYSNQNIQANKESLVFHPAPYDTVLREIIIRTYGCQIINKDNVAYYRNLETNNQSQYSKMFETNSNIYSVLCGIETKSYIFLVHDNFIEYNIYDCITYSPSILGSCYNKPLFIIYQLVSALESMHNKGLVMGEMTMEDIYVDENLWIQIMPRLEDNLNEVLNKLDECSETKNHKNRNKANCACPNCLKSLTSRWCVGQISNFDYLTILNNLAGRKIGDPSNHHVMPWVTDFSSRSGNNWRDLTKSKYRLNKGDCQLDLTYSQSTTKLDDVFQIPHHISDLLSDITYYVYMARRTNRSLLTKHVRPLWVPAEYPNSIQRLQQWSPEECIPEFYSDPTVFRTIHEDLPDLALPAWATCAEDFVARHREALESQYVSERLHHWIDLTFGHKLSGPAAVKAKNVCLMSCENNTYLSKSGVVQLFEHAHPARFTWDPFHGKLPPRIYSNADRKHSVSPRLTRSSEDLTLSSREHDVCSQNRIHNSPSQSSQKSLSSQCSDDRSNYNTCPKNSSTIYLPKEYNPISQLIALENLENFTAKTLLSGIDRKAAECKADEAEKLTTESVSKVENSFVNKLFEARMETGENFARVENSAPGLNDVPDIATKPNYKQIVAGRRLREMQILGCLVVEIFHTKRLRPFGHPAGQFESRLRNCIAVLRSGAELPPCVRSAVRLLLQLDNLDITDSPSCGSKYPTVTDRGLPPPSAHQLLQPLLWSAAFPFPRLYPAVHGILGTLVEFNRTLSLLEIVCFSRCDGWDCDKFENTEKIRQNFVKKISECKVKTLAAQIEFLLDQSSFEQFGSAELVLPFFKDLLVNPDTATLAAWYLFDPVAKSLGIQGTINELLEPILSLYERHEEDYRNFSIIYRTKKSVKLYHHSFLLKLIVRFGLKCFLDNFATRLIEAVGGCRDIDQGEFSSKHVHRKSSTRRTLKSVEVAKVPDNCFEEPDMFTFDEDSKQQKNALDLTSESDSVLDLQINHLQAEEATEENDQLIDCLEERLKQEHFGEGEMESHDDLLDKGGDKEITLIVTKNISNDFQAECIENEGVNAKENIEKLKRNKSRKSRLERGSSNSRISEMSSDSLIWLAHRLGPVLTARYLSRNLLKMLSLCYLGDESLRQNAYGYEVNYRDISQTRRDVSKDRRCRRDETDIEIAGDEHARRVMDCLMSIAVLYGPQFICVQYLPHAAELVSLCRRNKLTSALQAGLLASLQLARCSLPYLSDRTLMDLLQDVLLKSIMLPSVRVLGSTKNAFPGGETARLALAGKVLHAIYELAERIGPEMTREHVCVPGLQRFFLIFDKAFVESEGFKDVASRDNSTTDASEGADEQETIKDENDQLIDQEKLVEDDPQTKALAEIRRVFDQCLALKAYSPFLRLLGECTMERCLSNHALIRKLCQQEYQNSRTGNSLESSADTPTLKINIPDRPEDRWSGGSIDFSGGSGSFGSNVAVIGNRIEVGQLSSTGDASAGGDASYCSSDVTPTVSTAYRNPTGGGTGARHLKGNWLAYWEHEIGRPDKDNSFNIKQIKLQTFSGHTNAVRSLVVLDNENSFASASRDKTVRLWSLRSEGDGSVSSPARWLYSGHRKPVSSLVWCDYSRTMCSCDSAGSLHVWDPYVGKSLIVLNGTNVNVLKALPSPSNLILAGTTESSVKLIDLRTKGFAQEWKTGIQGSCPVRALAVSCQSGSDWSHLLVGLASGHAVVLDKRGSVACAQWRAHDGELLQATEAARGVVVTSGLDHSVIAWSASDGRPIKHLRGHTEPAHLLAPIGTSGRLVSGTTANRLAVHSTTAFVSFLDASNASPVMMSDDGSSGCIEGGGDGATGGSSQPAAVHRLRSEAFKGVLTSLVALPMNRMLLLGSDGGNINLIC